MNLLATGMARSILAKRARIPNQVAVVLASRPGPFHSPTAIPSHQPSPPGRFFHVSSRTSFPVRRRRRPSTTASTSPDADHTTADDDGTASKNPLKHVAVDDDEDFILGANALLDKLEKSVESMKKQNETFVVERFFSDLGEVLTIDLGPKEGKYRIEMSLEDHVFEYSSPISGKILYILSAHSGEWVGIEDGHLFEGIFVRDLIRQCQGLPNL